jgi:cyclopropane fatty-acyl-phospholipid synthase-like methyltransferase
MTSPAAIWHDVECGSYGADLALWEELTQPGDTVLDIGCGTGRVALHLARRGRAVTAIDREPQLLAELERRAARAALHVPAVCADARDFDLGVEFDAVLAPMQFIQLFRGARERAAMLARAAAHLRPGGLFATTLMNLEGEVLGDEYGPPPPDMREVDRWVYSSLSVGVRPVDRGEAIVIERVRTAVSPEGRQSRSVDEVEDEIAAAGLVVHERHEIPATEDHVASVAVTALRREES